MTISYHRMIQFMAKKSETIPVRVDRHMIRPDTTASSVPVNCLLYIISNDHNRFQQTQIKFNSFDENFIDLKRKLNIKFCRFMNFIKVLNFYFIIFLKISSL